MYINITPSLKRVYFRMIPVHPLLLRTEFQVKVSLHLCFLQKIHERSGFTRFSDSPLSNKNRSKKWYHSFIFHFNDLIIVQEWLLYRRESRGTGVPAKEKMSLCDFKLHIAEYLSIQTAKTRSKKTRKNKC